MRSVTILELQVGLYVVKDIPYSHSLLIFQSKCSINLPFPIWAYGKVGFRQYSLFPHVQEVSTLSSKYFVLKYQRGKGLWGNRVSICQVLHLSTQWECDWSLILYLNDTFLHRWTIATIYSLVVGTLLIGTQLSDHDDEVDTTLCSVCSSWC